MLLKFFNYFIKKIDQFHVTKAKKNFFKYVIILIQIKYLHFQV